MASLSPSFFTLSSLRRLLRTWSSQDGGQQLASVPRNPVVQAQIAALRSVGKALTGYEPSSDAIAAALAALLQ